MYKHPLGLYFMEKMTAAEKLDLHYYEMDKPNMVDMFVFCRLPLRKRPLLGTRSAAQVMSKLNMVDKFVFCRPPLMKRPRLET